MTLKNITMLWILSTTLLTIFSLISEFKEEHPKVIIHIEHRESLAAIHTKQEESFLSKEFYQGLNLTLASHILGYVGKHDGILMTMGLLVDVARLYNIVNSEKIIEYGFGSICGMLIVRCLFR